MITILDILKELYEEEGDTQALEALELVRSAYIKWLLKQINTTR